MPVSAPFRGLQATSLLVVLTYTCFFSARQRGRRDAKADTYLNAAERSAFEHGVSAEKGATAKRLSQVLGRKILFIDADEDFHGCTIDGVIYLGAKSERSVLTTVAHEYTHLLESKGLYKKLRDFVFDTLAGEGATEEDLRAAKRAEHLLYAGLDDGKVDREIVAEFVETRLLTDEQAMRAVVRREGKSFARRLLDTLRGLIEKIKAALHIGDADAEQLKMLERGRDILAEVIRSEETSEAADGIAFAFVGKNKNGIRKYETDFPADMPQAERGRLFKERLATIFNLGAVELKTDVKKIKVQADRITYKKNIYGDVGGIDSISAKVNALYDLVDILETSVFKSATMEPSFANENVAAKNLAHKGVKYWYKFENHIILDGVPYKVVFNIRDKGKEQYQYLIEFDKETAQNSNKKRTSANDTAADGQLRAFMQKSSDTTVSQKNSGVNSKYTQNSKNDADIDGFSVGGVETDSEGNTLSEAQQKFFSDSLVTDEDGALLPVYHATDSAEFTVFDKSKLGYNTDGNTSDEGMAATAHVGFWFNTKDLTGEAGSRAEKVYLNLTNPYELTSLDALAEEIKALGEGETPAEMGEAYATDLWLRGYDGIEIQNDEEFGGTSYVAFDENQIKRTTNKNPTKDADIRFSVGGVNAKTAEVGRLADAERMEQGGADSETVRRETGWYRGYDGKWRFEIDDSKMHFINHREESRRTWKLDELIRHDALFAAYPELRDYTVLNFGISDDVEAAFYPGLNRITLDPRLSRAEKRAALIHEIQHAIQLIEGFTAGATTDYWRGSLKTAEEKQLELRLRDFDAPDIFFEADMRKLLEGTPAAERDAAQTALEKHYGEAPVREYVDLYNRLRDLRAEREQDAERAYRNTAGEIEAVDVANRLGLSERQRAETRPDIDRTNVRFSNEHPMFTMEARKAISDFVDEAIDNKGRTEEERNQIRISRAPQNIVDDVYRVSAGKINISGKYFALEGSKLYHEYIRHSDQDTEHARGQVALSLEDIKKAAEIFYSPDIVECIFADTDNPTQQQSFALAKEAEDGSHYVLVVESVGGKRNPNIVPAEMLKIKPEKWNRYIGAGKSIADMVYANETTKRAAIKNNADNINNRVTVARLSVQNAQPASSTFSSVADSTVSQKERDVNSYSMQNPGNDAEPDEDIRFSVGDGQTDADAEVSDADKRFAPVESAIKLLQGGADLWRTLRETGASPREIALRMATSGESDTAIRELTGLYRDALGVWTYDKAWFDTHVPDIADTRELRAGYKLGTVDEQMLGLAPEEVKASRRRLLDSAKLPNDADAARVRQTAANLHRGLRPTAAEFAEDRKTAAAKEAARLITAEKVPSADAAIRTGALLADIADVLEKKKVRAETITRLTAQVRGENGAWETDNAAMTKIIRAGSKQLDVQDFTDFLFENAKELTESSYNSQYGHKETYALDKLGVQIQNPIVDIAKYGTKPSELIANEREQEELKRYIENEYASAAHPSPAERADARDVKREFLPDMKTVGEVARFYLDRTKWRMLYCVCI